MFVQTNVHRKQDKQYFSSINVHLPVATNSSIELIKYATDALERIFREDINYQKCGCIANDLVPETQIQFSMYDNLDRKKDKQIMNTVDRVNNRFGMDLVRFAKQGYSKKWKLRQMKLSPCYTTRIEDVLKIKN